MSRPRPQNQPPSTPLSPHQRQQPTPTRCRTPNPRHRHRRPQKRTLTIKKRTIKCRPFLVALFATPFHFFHPAPSPIIPLLPIYLIIPIYLSHWVSISSVKQHRLVKQTIIQMNYKLWQTEICHHFGKFRANLDSLNPP